MSDADREKWNALYRDASTSAAPSSQLVEILARWPKTGRALDVAGGTGANARALSERGFHVTLVDISDVGLETARAKGHGRVITVQADLERDALPAGPFDLILCASFLLRPLFAELPSRLAPDGLAIFIHPTVRNLERHARPSRRFLLDEGEAPSLFPTLRILEHSEGWSEDGRHLAQLVAQSAQQGRQTS
ncbi:MAG: class I SAM-dependent methyltransferase [Deltaproteobacteria bacterium]|nr:class I SAM-dependent methyltransferase [Deltaproteobacteria bacterium]